MINYKRCQKLASKWLNNTITEAEKTEFIAWYNSYQDEDLLIPESFAENEQVLKERLMAKIKEKIAADTHVKKPVKSIKRIGIAAAVTLLAVSIGFYLLQPQLEKHPDEFVQEDVEPGGDRAMLMLADGRTFVLDSLSIGEIAAVSGMKISKTADGQIVYEASPASLEEVGYSINTISTPRGGQYRVVLPDGTAVWLNSASSLSYPTRFSSNERRVTLLAGEAYFEVKSADRQSGKIPFIVETAGQEVKVLGTAFNINAYEDENGIRTTLVEGSVSVTHSGISGRKTLIPGQQLRFDTKSMQIDVIQVDTDEFSAWKDGFFYFNDADIYTVMRQLSRWYDIEVVYEISDPKDLYIGKIPRRVNLATALNVLKKAGVNFEIRNDRQLVIMPEQ